ncbi:MAG: hypothetical protein K2P81_01800 [Bacteriovoracaceae bacterium]|nr:hypothetical protein [Bacteriovoracaceae bacterium]
MKTWFSFFIVFSVAHATEVKFDKHDKLHGVTVESGKTEKTRVYRGYFERKVEANLETVKASITNFAEKCNDAYKSRREWISKDQHCMFKNENLVETREEKNLLKTAPQTYVLSRHGYNRGTFQYQELVQETVRKDESNRNVVEIRQVMLSEKEAKDWVKDPIKNNSVFDRMTGVFVLTELSNNETEIKYEYRAETTHWLLNKEVTVPQVFASMGKGIQDLWVSIEGKSLPQRNVATQN